MATGITFTSAGLGDKLIITSLAENYYLNTGDKLIDLDNAWFFDYNPYVLRFHNAKNKPGDQWGYLGNDTRPEIINGNIEYDTFTDVFICDSARGITDRLGCRVFGIADRLKYFFNLQKLYLRHSRLYKYEDNKTLHGKLVVHTQGKSLGGEFSDKLIAQIQENYDNYEITQVGGLNDKTFPGAIDKRGQKPWDLAREIATAAVFIGVESGPLHVARCFPKVRKKLVLNYLDEKQLNHFTPMFEGAAWWDFNQETYCNFPYDIGSTMSYLKI